jgi:hypothetical protein
MSKGSAKGRCPLCKEEEDAINVLLKCPETRKWGNFFSKTWLIVNGKVAYKRIINCTKENTCIKLDINGRIKSVICNWKWEMGE